MYLTANPTVPAMTVPQQGATLLNILQAVAANTANVITLAGAAGQRITIRGIYVKATGAAATSTIIVQDGVTTVLDLGTVTIPLAGATIQFAGNPLMTGSAGNNVVITVGAGGALSVTTVSIIADRQ
jgi:hypothetical protein